MAVLVKFRDTWNQTSSKTTVKCILLLMTFFLTCAMVYMVSEEVVVTSTLMNIKYPPPFFPGYQSGVTHPSQQKKGHQEIELVNKQSANDTSSWIYHTQYKNLLHLVSVIL